MAWKKEPMATEIMFITVIIMDAQINNAMLFSFVANTATRMKVYSKINEMG